MPSSVSSAGLPFGGVYDNRSGVNKTRLTRSLRRPLRGSVMQWTGLVKLLGKGNSATDLEGSGFMS